MNLDSTDFMQDFPQDGKIYLNNASVSLMPFLSIEAMKNFLVNYSAKGPDSIDSDVFLKEKLIRIRRTISNLIHCRPEEIVFTQSTTDGVNMVATGLSFDSKSNVVIRGMAHEHHANYYPWLRLSQKLSLKSLKTDLNGFFDIKKTKSNFMSFNGSKWLCGPMGTGIFYCKKESSKLLEPSSIGGESAMVYDETNLVYKDIPDKFQTGFRNYVGFVGLEASINYMLQFGLNNIRSKIMKLSNQMREELSKISGITLFGPEDQSKRTSIVSFSIDGQEPQKIVELLEKKKIVIAVREIVDKKILRASPH